jgi:hypothetical protein
MTSSVGLAGYVGSILELPPIQTIDWVWLSGAPNDLFSKHSRVLAARAKPGQTVDHVNPMTPWNL